VRIVLAIALLFLGFAAYGASKAKPAYGALAYHRESGSFGYAVDQPSDRAARVESLRQCAHPNCEVVLRFRHDCGAVANGPTRHSAAKGVTRQEAETKALRACGTECTLVGWACTR
jgi:hypothetical protein